MTSTNKSRWAPVAPVLQTLVSQKPQFGTTALHALPVFIEFSQRAPARQYYLRCAVGACGRAGQGRASQPNASPNRPLWNMHTNPKKSPGPALMMPQVRAAARAAPRKPAPVIDPVETLETHIRMNCWELPAVNGVSPHQPAASEADQATAEKVHTIEKIERRLQTRRKRPNVDIPFDMADQPEPSPILQTTKLRQWADPQLLTEYHLGSGGG